jgi:hypothetical protein
MANRIDNPTYLTFKRAVLNGWNNGSNWNRVTIPEICKEWKVSPAIASAWLSRMEKDRQQEIAQYERNKD